MGRPTLLRTIPRVLFQRRSLQQSSCANVKFKEHDDQRRRLALTEEQCSQVCMLIQRFYGRREAITNGTVCPSGILIKCRRARLAGRPCLF